MSTGQVQEPYQGDLIFLSKKWIVCKRASFKKPKVNTYVDEKTTQNLYRFLCLACFLSILSQYSYIILFFSSLAEQQIIATIIAVIMESTSQHELSLCSGFFNAQYYIEVRSSSDRAYTYYVHTKGTHIAFTLARSGSEWPFDQA